MTSLEDYRMKAEQSTPAQTCINTIRFLSADAIQKANSGHPGAPMGAAPMAFVLWDEFLRHNPRNPGWFDRDRFVLSAGHASMLLYSLLHLTGYELSLEEIKNFRQWGSKTPGHPEYGSVPGIEATTGPLGQGLAHAVGMAVAEAHLAARYNREGHEIVDHFTYVLASDGDLMEGVAAEACSLAGHLGLGKLIVLYDDNKISLAGSTGLCFSEDVGVRFDSYGWHVIRVMDGNDLDAISEAIKAARYERTRPSLIPVRTYIAFGSPEFQGTYKAHGSPLGEEELAAAKKNLGWPVEPLFHIPEEAVRRFRAAVDRGDQLERSWRESFESFVTAYPGESEEFARAQMGGMPEGWDSGLPVFQPTESGPPTRKASEAALQALGAKLPELVGGSADLNPSTYTWIKGAGDFESPGTRTDDTQGAIGGGWDYAGRNIHFGVREHAMGAMAGGMALHGGIIPFTGTFLVFSDYMRPPMRLAAMNRRKIVYVFTHDSIGVGEDGPTHQPVEHVMSLRAVPNLTVIRPADANEAVQAWRAAILNDDGPTALVLTRQKLPVLDHEKYGAALALQRGAYVLWRSEPSSATAGAVDSRAAGDESGASEAGDAGAAAGELDPFGYEAESSKSSFESKQAAAGSEVILIGTGSEVHVALEAGEKLAAMGAGVRVVSMPSWELFEAQDADYREMVLPSSIRARVAVEAGLRTGWERYVGLNGAVVGMDGYGASAPAKELYEKFGITAENVVARALRVLESLK
jgi:transketolase